MNRLKALREEKGITQKQLSKDITVSQKTISNYESGKSIPDLDSLILFANYYHVSLDYIAGLSEQRVCFNDMQVTTLLDMIAKTRLLEEKLRKQKEQNDSNL